MYISISNEHLHISTICIPTIIMNCFGSAFQDDMVAEIERNFDWDSLLYLQTPSESENEAGKKRYYICYIYIISERLAGLVLIWPELAVGMTRLLRGLILAL